MKTKLLFLLFFTIGFSFFGRAQTQTANKTVTDSTYAMVYVVVPQSVFGDYEIKISYGNGKIEEYKNVSKKRSDLADALTNSFNYMSKKGYVLKETMAYPGVEIQYIFERK